MTTGSSSLVEVRCVECQVLDTLCENMLGVDGALMCEIQVDYRLINLERAMEELQVEPTTVGRVRVVKQLHVYKKSRFIVDETNSHCFDLR